MGKFSGIGGRLLLILVVALCMGAGMYAQYLNAESKIAGWAVGIGAALILASTVVFAGSMEQKALKGSALIALGVLPMGLWIARPLMVMGAYQPHLAEYMAVASINPDPFGASMEANIKGKLVPVDMSKKKIDPLMMALPERVRPSNPGEVGTIAALWWHDRQIGTYGGKGGAYQWECTLVLWDKAAKTPLAEERFQGGEPPSTSRDGASQWGSKPYDEIAAYLEKLH